MASLVQGKAAQAVVATEFDDHHLGVEAQDCGQAGDGILRCGSAGSLVDDLIVIAAGIQLFLQEVRISLARLQAVARGNAISKAGQHGTVCGVSCNSQDRDKQRGKQRNDKSSANVHLDSVANSLGLVLSSGRERSLGRQSD